MPKRRNYEEDYQYLQHKMRKLERKMAKVSSRSFSSDPEIENDNPIDVDKPARTTKEDTVISANDWIIGSVEPVPITEPTTTPALGEVIEGGEVLVSEVEPQQNPAETETPKVPEELPVELDEEILQILGEAPSTSEKYGPIIREELACRLQHMATEGIGKEARKQIGDKYLIPANCLHINAPKINPEMKAAIPEPISKRDKAIEYKQKQLGSAIACLSSCLDTLLKVKDKDNDLIMRLMDATRLLCDIQHTDSTTRRSFILSSLKKEVKEHLNLTKIDSMLFSANLAETLKSAKAVNKSGTELKSDYFGANKQAPAGAKKDNTSSSKPFLHRRPAPVAARRPMGPAFREQAASRGHPHRPQPGRSSRPSSYRPQAPAHRRS